MFHYGKKAFQTANDYRERTVITMGDAQYAYLHNQDEDDFFVANPETGDLLIDPSTGQAMRPRLDTEYSLLRAGMNAYYGYTYYKNVMLTKSADGFLKSKCGVCRDSYDVSIMLRLKTADDVLTSMDGRPAPNRAPMEYGQTADILTFPKRYP